MERNVIEIAKSARPAAGFDITVDDMDKLRQNSESLLRLMSYTFNYGFEMGARANAAGEYQPYQMEDAQQDQSEFARRLSLCFGSERMSVEEISSLLGADAANVPCYGAEIGEN